ncbi:hypothetical protein [Thiorhodococcus minor]|nr:hypothetical protein [Thiorhodococcus minor]
MAEIRTPPRRTCKPTPTGYGWPPSMLALLVSVVVTGTGLIWMQRELDRSLAVRPPIVVLDLSAAARETDPARLKTLLDHYRTTAERLAGQGLLVLDRQAVLAAPKGLILTDREVRHAAD